MLAAFSMEASDIRTINNRTVDVQPIHDWKSKVKAGDPKEAGERPMKHWKDVEVVEIVQTFSSSMHVVKANIEGVEQVITLRNIPADLCAKLAKLQTLRSRLGGAQFGTQVAKADAAAAKIRASGGIYVSASDDLVNAVLEEERKKKNRAASAEVKAELAEGGLVALKTEIASLSNEVSKTPFLAMAIGTTYAGKPEWDTGLKQ